MKTINLVDDDTKAFAFQLFDIRRRKEQLEVEERTLVDKLATIMRGRGAQRCYVGEFQIDRGIVDQREVVIVIIKGATS